MSLLNKEILELGLQNNMPGPLNVFDFAFVLEVSLVS
jgi:hypothetical protein